ncbi:chaperone J-domain-containing protein [Auricularia subglabra TFB-10046 SS5]|nr:chaperone J-domain-containing protein [Auricularia subglabra TFB-10046 SS5]
MLGHTGDVIARLVAWTFLPDFITRQLLKFFYRGQPNPNAYRRTFALVVAAYLAYNVFQASVSTPPNLYQILGVPTSADDGQLKTAFRNFARKNHPDRAGPKAEPLFIMVRDAYDGLKHPVKRFAYDRFGPDIFKWDNCATPRDYVNTGLLASCGFYIGSTFFMMVFWLFGSRDSGSYWRYMLFFGLLISELALVLAPSFGATSGVLGTLFPHRVPYQHVLYLHQLFLSVSIAISRIVPALAPDIDPSGSSAMPPDPQALADLTEQLARFARNVEVESVYRFSLLVTLGLADRLP